MIINIELKLDVQLLKKQKCWLVNQPSSEETEGLIGLLDAIQDHLVDVMGLPQEEVFCCDESN